MQSGNGNDMDYACIGVGIQQFLVQVFPITNQHGFCQSSILLVFDVLPDNGQYLFPDNVGPAFAAGCRLSQLDVLVGALQHHRKANAISVGIGGKVKSPWIGIFFERLRDVH